jgi:hypothetical protein
MCPVKTFVGLLVFLLGITFFIGESHTLFGAEKANQFLGDKHGEKGIECNSCHKENTPQTAVPTAVCLQCHGGTYEKLADRTRANPNPHLSHLENLACESCHHSHKESENKCGGCHDFDFKVP